MGSHDFRMRFKPQEDKQLAYHLSNIDNLHENLFCLCDEIAKKCLFFIKHTSNFKKTNVTTKVKYYKKSTFQVSTSLTCRCDMIEILSKTK